MPFDPLWVDGPLARTVEDAALMLDAMGGPDPADPLTALTFVVTDGSVLLPGGPRRRRRAARNSALRPSLRRWPGSPRCRRCCRCSSSRWR